MGKVPPAIGSTYLLFIIIVVGEKRMTDLMPRILALG